MRSRCPSRPYTLLSVLLCCALLATPSAAALKTGGANAPHAPKGDPPTAGAPGKNLPNLDEVRRRGPARPKALPPVPSKHKKCPPDEPDCNRKSVGNAASASDSVDSNVAGSSNARVLLDALASALNIYGGVTLASTSRGLPAPPPEQNTETREVESTGWLSSIKARLWAGATPRRMPAGVFQDANCDAVSGWAWDSAQPNTPVMVSLFSGSELVATTLANQYRADISAGDGRHGFRMALPDSLRDGATHSLSVRIQLDGTDFTLDSSPKTVSSCSVAYDGAITSADCDQITGWAWDSQRPTTPVDVDIYVDGAFRARASADGYNAQLGKGDNRHQFRLPTPVAARDGLAHSITVRPAGSNQSLGSSASVTCTGPTYQGYVGWATCDYIYGWVWDSQRPTTPVNVDLYSDGQFVTTAAADVFGQDLVNAGIGDGRHWFQITIPDSLRNGSQHTLTVYVSGGGPPVSGSASMTCAARPGCSASQSLPSTEFVKGFYLGALARQPRPLELQYWNDALRAAAEQSQAALLAKAKLLGRELFLEGEYAGRGRMSSSHESEYVSDLYWAYLQRGPDASGLSFWVGNIQSQGQSGWLNALAGFEGSGEFSARVAGLCPSPADSARNYDAALDFSPLQNADGAWAYGYRATSGSAFALYPAHVLTASPPPAYDTWYQPAITDPSLTPLVRHVAGSQTLLMHPGPQGQQSVVRWTAPAAATVLISGRFEAANTATTDVHVRLNSSTALFDGQINGSGSAAPFSLTRTVAAGDVIEFAVGYGSNGTYNGDATTLAVTVSQPPPAQTQPYNNSAAQMPGNIEAELFDAGGEGVAYHDTTAGTHGLDQDQQPQPPTAFRSPTDVDIYKHTSYSNGYLVVMQAGDWMNYTVDVAQSGSYTLAARTSYWSATGGLFHVEADGVDATGPLQHTAGSTFQTITKPGVQLNAGRHVLRVVCDTNGTDNAYMGALDYLRLTADEDAGVAARWKFDEGSGTTASDSTGNGSAGTLGGGASWSSGFIGSGSLNFNGTSNYVSVPSPSSALSSVSNNFTISFWANPRSAHEIDPEGVTGVAGVAGQRYVFGPSNSSNSTDSGAGVSVGTNGVSVYEHGAGYMPATLVHQGAVNGWTHVAVVYENRQPKLYLNGQLVRIGYTSPKAAVRVTPWNLGGNSYGYFDGQVDDVRVYDRVLSAGEIGSLTSAGGVDPTGNAFSEAEKDPANQTGSGGDDPLSRNFDFSVPLVGLQGRAGLGLGLSLTYNSLVWTRDASANAVKFDADYGDPSPGFRLGLPVIHRRYRNSRNENAYMLVTPSGARTELRQVGASNTYEATDSSYTQLTEDNGLTLRPTDGSQLSFALKGYEFKCTKIKDRNGNFITVAYNAAGNVSSVTDTLGRVITFTYDANDRPLAIVQNRGGESHQWATFAYASQTMNAGFAAGVNVTGPANGTSISVLSRVSLDDGSFYNFAYNSWGQVYKVERRASDGSAAGRLLSYQEYDLLAPTPAQTGSGTDCPRFTVRKDFVKDWNGDAPVYTTYSSAAGGVQVVKNNRVLSGSQVVDTPDTVTQELTYDASNTWRRGLVTQVQTYWQGDLRRTAQSTWTQDDESLPYELNPRVKVSEVSDPQGNHTGTTLDYTSYGLPTDAYEWSGTASNVLRRTHEEYNLDPAYVGRRLIGLVNSKSVYDEQGRVASKVDYTYDQGGQFLQHQGEPVQHDAANYGAGFVAGRGLVTSVRRWDVTALHDITKSVESRAGYNTTGSLIFSRDPLGHQSSVSYADRFSDAAGINTLAYVTAVTDAGGFSSKVEYSYHMGQVTRTEDPKGAQGTYTYDAAGRSLRVEASGKGAGGAVVSGGYTRWVYSDSMDAVQTWTQVDAGKPEVCSISVVDGAGAMRAKASDFPGNGGGYRAQYVTYDIAGRAYSKSNLAEVNGLWNLAGDDAAAGEWKFTTQTYDWKGRPLVTTLPKLAKTTDPGYATEQPVTREAEYGGCGCAGGEVVTTKGELVPTNDPAGPAQARRTQKVYSDALGRAVQSVLYNWNGTTVDSSTTTKYNALDQPSRAREYQGAVPTTEPDGEGSGYQTTTFAYDGHGRLLSRHTPEQDANRSTVYAYNADDTVTSVTDARGAKAVYGYDARHLLASVGYDLTGVLANQNVAASPAVTYVYDSTRNRTSMTERDASNNVVGVSTYTYDAFSRMAGETRSFPALAANSHNPYTVAYTYTLSGKLKTLTDPFGAQLNYDYDNAGQLTDVRGGAAYAGVTNYVSGIQYRAWGGVKAASFGETLAPQATQTTQYDARMRPTQYRLTPGATAGLREDFTYYDDSRLRTITDLDDGTRQPSPQYLTMSRSYTYDHAGRVKKAGGVNNPSPYLFNYAYDAFGNMISRSGNYGYQFSPPDSATYTNGRRNGWTYNAGGQLTVSPANGVSNGRTWQYDAAGRLVSTSETSSANVVTTLTDVYDGDGRIVYNSAGGTANTFYLVHSTVLGGEVLTRLTSTGEKGITYVPAGGVVKPRQTTNSNNQPAVEWSYIDAVGVTEQGTGGLAGYDPLGNYAPLPPPPPSGGPAQSYAVNAPNYNWAPSSFTNFGNLSTGCTLDGTPADCNSVRRAISNGQAGTVTISTSGGADTLFAAGLGAATASIVHGLTHPRFGTIIPPSGVRPSNDSQWRDVTFLAPGTQFPEIASVGGGVPGPQTQSLNGAKASGEAVVTSDCMKAVDDLMSRLYVSGAPLMEKNQVAMRIGQDLAWEARNGRLRGGHNNPKLGVTGFRSELIMNGQGADVYLHVYGVAGAALIGDFYTTGMALKIPGLSWFRRTAPLNRTGYEMAQGQLADDEAQKAGGRLESVAEVNDDWAAFDVAAGILDLIDGRITKQQLRDRIARRLCDH